MKVLGESQTEDSKGTGQQKIRALDWPISAGTADSRAVAGFCVWHTSRMNLASSLASRIGSVGFDTSYDPGISADGTAAGPGIVSI